MSFPGTKLQAVLALSLSLLLVSQGGPTPDQTGPYTVGQDIVASFPLAGGTRSGHLYWPTNAPNPAPPLVVGHGFARTSAELTNWGAHFASHGFVVAVVDFPNRFAPNHAINATIMLELIDHLRTAPAPIVGGVDPVRAGLVGHSAGGLSTILAAAQAPSLTAAVGLDPVDAMGAGVAAAPSVIAPMLVLGALPSMCNAQGSASTLFAGLGSSGSWSVNVVGSTHCDGEDPSNALCRATCGGEDVARRTLYRRYATAHLLASFFCTATEFLPGGIGLGADLTAQGISDLMLIGNPPCGGSNPDAGIPDTGWPDLGSSDLAVREVGLFDDGVPRDRGPGVDLGPPPDTGVPRDTGVQPDSSGPRDVGDAGDPRDAATADASANDGGSDQDSGSLTGGDDEGCGCRAGAVPRAGPSLSFVLLLMAGFFARRRR